jgi:hypothetical protein
MGIAVAASALQGGQVIQTISDLVTRAQANSGTSSLIEITSPGRVEPLCIVSSSCMHLDYTTDVLQTLQSLFTGYYLQAIDMIGQVSNPEVLKVLDSLNPNRNTSLTAAMKALGNVYDGNKYSPENYRGVQEPNWRLSQEAYKFRLPTTTNKLAMENEMTMTSNIQGVKDSNQLFDASNLALGKLIKVKIKAGKDTDFNMQLAIRMSIVTMPSTPAVALLTTNRQDVSYTERYYAWRAGRISFVNDLLLSKDLIRERRKALIEDETGIYKSIINRVNKNRMAGFVSGNPSLNMASDLVVISEVEAAEVESKLNGKLSNSRTRDKMFDGCYAMIVAVINRDWQRVTFYTRGIATSTDLSVKELKSTNKGNGPDLADILKAYSMQQTPNF